MAFGVLPGILLAVAVALADFIWRSWRPHDAVLGRVVGIKGYHDVARHPDARQVPGLVMFRWDSPLFFANAGMFRRRLLDVVAQSSTPTKRVIIAAEPMTDIDTTAAETLTQLTEELRVARDLQGEWRTKAEEYNLKLRGRGGGGGAGDGGGVAKQELLELEQKLAEVNRLRMLDAEQLAKQRASLERLEELEVRSLAAEKAAAECRRESDDWRNKAEGYAAELVAWRSKSEHWEATKAQSIRGLQQERDRLQNEWQMMRE